MEPISSIIVPVILILTWLEYVIDGAINQDRRE